MISDKELNRYLAHELEGGLFAHCTLTTIDSDIFLGIRYYTVLDGVVYELYDDKVTASGDTLLNISYQCVREGNYEPGKSYPHPSKNLSYKRFKRMVIGKKSNTLRITQERTQ